MGGGVSVRGGGVGCVIIISVLVYTYGMVEELDVVAVLLYFSLLELFTSSKIEPITK